MRRLVNMNILMLLSNEYRPDPRVRKEALTLHEAGHTVTILCWNRSLKVPDHQDDGGVVIERVRTDQVDGMLGLAANAPIVLRARLSPVPQPGIRCSALPRL